MSGVRGGRDERVDLRVVASFNGRLALLNYNYHFGSVHSKFSSASFGINKRNARGTVFCGDPMKWNEDWSDGVFSGQVCTFHNSVSAKKAECRIREEELFDG